MTTAFDYSSLKASADSLITRFGTSIVLSRASRSADLDVWEQDQGPTSTSAAQSISGLTGVRLNLTLKSLTSPAATFELSTPERPTARWVFQASTAIPEVVGPEWIFTADGLSYQVVNVRPVQPGTLLLLYFATVAL